MSYPPQILSPLVLKVKCRDIIDGKPVIICKIVRDYEFKDNPKPDYRNVLKRENDV